MSIRAQDLKFTGLLGKCEQECAAKRIVVVTQGCRETPVQEHDFRTNLEISGFKELIENGWLIPDVNAPAGFYEVKPEFWEKVGPRSGV